MFEDGKVEDSYGSCNVEEYSFKKNYFNKILGKNFNIELIETEFE